MCWPESCVLHKSREIINGRHTQRPTQTVFGLAVARHRDDDRKYESAIIYTVLIGIFTCNATQHYTMLLHSRLPKAYANLRVQIPMVYIFLTSLDWRVYTIHVSSYVMMMFILLASASFAAHIHKH